eukprot:TRINITY_DN51597_c0_g1_i1.p1 TRINITY_DN51597_c0_g1~~TRINITY_DN51597_c0_g1_i1.p1  ORF type:complete len:361 (-),score=58.59 TRINITY_DN51597_c0_g1_i1:19-1101(-)
MFGRFERFRRPLTTGLVGAPSIVLALRHWDVLPGNRKHLYCLEQHSEANAESCVEANFMGLHKKGLVNPGEWHTVTLYPPMSMGLIWQTFRYFVNIIRPSVPVKVWNARELEASEGLSKVDFFNKYGFVLLDRQTAMSAEDWMASAPKTLDYSNFAGLGMPDIETPLSRKYALEVKQIIKELLPKSTIIELDPLCARRGPGTKNPNYSFGAHCDYGLVADDWLLATPEFRERMVNPDFSGIMVLNFWRPVLPMKGPVKKHPLAVCDPRTVKFEDIVPISIRWDELGYVRMLTLAHDPEQKWYYYPDMTTDEVLVFKSFQYFKSQAGPELNTCFHTAFEHPQAPPNAEARQSSEYRVRVWF